MIISRHSFLIGLIVAVILAAPLAAQDCLDAPEAMLDEADYLYSIGDIRLYKTTPINADAIISMECHNYIISADLALATINSAKRVAQSHYDESPNAARCEGTLSQGVNELYYSIDKTGFIDVNGLMYYSTNEGVAK